MRSIFYINLERTYLKELLRIFSLVTLDEVITLWKYQITHRKEEKWEDSLSVYCVRTQQESSCL